jgi:hypothetical protein
MRKAGGGSGSIAGPQLLPELGLPNVGSPGEA